MHQVASKNITSPWHIAAALTVAQCCQAVILEKLPLAKMQFH